MITLTRDSWKKFAPGCPPAWTEALFANLDLLEDHGLLQTELRWCHFAGTVYAETGNFKYLRESLYYTTLSALRKAWPSRFGHMSDAEARTYLRNPRKLANKTYNGRMGNRPGSSDGFDFRGGGWIQTTGRSAVETYCKQLGIEAGPTTLDDPLITLQFAVLEWTNMNCNKWADENNLVKIAKAINVGSADSNVVPNGLDNRRVGFGRAWQQWGEFDGDAAVVAKAVSLKDVAAKVGAPAVAISTALSATPAGSPEPAVSTLATLAPRIAEAQPKFDAALTHAEQGLSMGQRLQGVVSQLGEFGGFLYGNPTWLILGLIVALAIIFLPKGSTA